MSTITLNNINDFVVHDAQGKEVKMQDMLKQVTLIVNIDCKVGEDSNSECKTLQELYVRHCDKGFEILGFPSDQFQFVSDQGNYVSALEVQQDLSKRYGVTFPILHKVDVNGDKADPLFLFLQKRLSGFPTNAIKWDFTKFLIVDGEPTKRYAPTTSPMSIEDEIVEALDKLPSRMRQQPDLTQGVGAEYGSYTAVPPSVNPWQEQSTFETGESRKDDRKGLSEDISKMRVSEPGWKQTAQGGDMRAINITQQELELSRENEPVRMDLFYIQNRDKKMQQNMPFSQEGEQWRVSDDKLSGQDTKLQGSVLGGLRDESGMQQDPGYIMGKGSDSNIPSSQMGSDVQMAGGVTSESHLQGIKPASHFHENESVLTDLHHRRHLQEHERE